MHIKDFMKKNKLNEGTKISFDFEGEKIEGVIIPSYDDNLMVKLDSGYNAGFSTKKIKNINILGKTKGVSKAAKNKIEHNPDLPTIALLHTGGTIASRVDYRTGAVYSSFEIEDLLAMFPELTELANFESTHIGNMWTDDFRFEHFTTISQEIAKSIKKGVKGIIIGMGTDNMTYASAALSFALENCPVPVLIVGAQRSSDRGSSDAAMNLICASEFVTKTNFKGVAICMHHSTDDEYCAILPATKTRKMHTSRRDAFKAINDTPVALVNYKTRNISWIKDKKEMEKNNGKFILKEKFESKVGILRISVNMFPEQFSFFTKNKFKGLIIEGTGLGHTPGHTPDKIAQKNKGIFPAIKEFIDFGGIVVMTSTCINGRVHMHVYDKGTDLTTLGVIPGEDMLTETAMVKLSWLLGNYKKKEVEELLAKNLRGEISEFSRIDVYDE